MNSKEIMRRTFAFQDPDRVARSFESDMVFASPAIKTPATDWIKTGDKKWERKDEWGNSWHRIDPTSKGEVAVGVLDNMEMIPYYQFPDYSNPADYAPVIKMRQNFPDKWLCGEVPGFAFNIARKMRKLENYFTDLLLERDMMRLLHSKIDTIVEAMIVNYADAGADSIMFWEDWGTQTQTFISPDLWYEEFYPRFEKLCALAHDKGIKVIMHSCGKIEKIMPGLIKAGIDCFQFDQPALHGIDTLALYRKQAAVTFWCPVDIQTTLQTRNEKTIRAQARELLDKLWQGKGGFIAGFYWDNAAIGLDPKWQEFACDEFLKQGTKERYQ